MESSPILLETRLVPVQDVSSQRDARPLELVLEVGLVLAAAAGALLVAATLFNAFLVDGAIASIDGRVEDSLWTWASSSAAFAAGLAAFGHALVSASLRRWSLFLGATLMYLSLDDFLVVHETVGAGLARSLELPSFVGGTWLLVYPPLLLAAAWALVRLGRLHGALVERHVLAGLALLGCGIVLEVVGIATKWIEQRGNAAPHAIRGALEEGSELAGSIVLAAALVGAFLLALAASSLPESLRTTRDS